MITRNKEGQIFKSYSLNCINLNAQKNRSKFASVLLIGLFYVHIKVIHSIIQIDRKED